MTMHPNIVRSAIVFLGLAVVGCGNRPIAATLDSRTKDAFGIHEWIILDDYNRGLSLNAETGDDATTILTFERGPIVRAVFLQHDMLTDRLIFKIDAPGNGYYGADLDGIADANPISLHKHPKRKGEGWVLASGKRDTGSVELVLRFAENSRAKLVLARE